MKNIVVDTYGINALEKQIPKNLLKMVIMACLVFVLAAVKHSIYRLCAGGVWEREYIGTDKSGNVFRCSNCANRIGLDRETDYCPNCGAKMDLEEQK